MVSQNPDLLLQSLLGLALHHMGKSVAHDRNEHVHEHDL